MVYAISLPGAPLSFLLVFCNLHYRVLWHPEWTFPKYYSFLCLWWMGFLLVWSLLDIKLLLTFWIDFVYSNLMNWLLLVFLFWFVCLFPTCITAYLLETWRKFLISCFPNCIPFTYFSCLIALVKIPLNKNGMNEILVLLHIKSGINSTWSK